MQAKKSNYHYEYFAFTDNLGYGRIFICRNRSRTAAKVVAMNARKGCYVIERHRVADFN